MEWLVQVGQPFVLIGVVVSLIWNAAIFYTQLKYIRNNMITKENLESAQMKLMANLKDWADEKFVTERECAGRIATLGPSHRAWE